MKKIIKKITIGITAFVMCATMLFSTITPVNALDPHIQLGQWKGNFKYKKYKYKWKTILKLGCIKDPVITKKVKTKKVKRRRNYIKRNVYKRKTYRSKPKQIKYTKSKSIVQRVVAKDVYTKITQCCTWKNKSVIITTHQRVRTAYIERTMYTRKR